MKPKIYLLPLLSVAIAAQLHGWTTRLVNDTDDTINVQVLVVGPSSKDHTHTLKPHEDRTVDIPGSYCFSRLKVNGSFPDNNWPAGAKCMYTANVIAKTGGEYTLRHRLSGLAADYVLNLKRDLSGAADQLAAVTTTLKTELRPLIAIPQKIAESTEQINTLIKEAGTQLRTIGEAKAELNTYDLASKGLPGLQETLTTMLTSAEKMITHLADVHNDTCKNGTNSSILCTTKNILQATTTEAKTQNDALLKEINALENVINTPVQATSTKSLTAPDRLRFIINDLL